MHPLLIPSASPFTLAEDSSLSHTLCSSLDPCSSHGFSSLQSPSAFPSFFSNDSSQQIEAFQPLSLDSAELCCCHLQHCCTEASLGITQDESVSQSNLNIVTSEEGPLLPDTDSQKFVCPFHSSPKKTQRQNCEAVQKDLGLECIPRGSLLQKSASAEHSISIPSYLSSSRDDTESSAFLPIQGGDNEKDQPVLSELNFQLLSSSPDLREQSALLCTNYSNDVYSKNGQISTTRQFESIKTHTDTASPDSHSNHSCYKSSCIMPFEVVSSALTTLTPIARNGDAGDKENFIEAHINGSRVRRVRLRDNLSPLCSVESKLDHIREGEKEALQEVHLCKKTLYSPCKEMYINVNATDEEASKENISPHVFKQPHKKVCGVMADSSGWMCPKDAKKNFKPKPRQLLLDKWLTRQR